MKSCTMQTAEHNDACDTTRAVMSDEYNEVEEDDWSNIMMQGDEHGNQFTYYDKSYFPLQVLPLHECKGDSVSISGNSNTQIPLTMELCCVNSLTPLDMLDLSNGEHDATGNRVWMGALFFMECMVRPCRLAAILEESQENMNISESTKIKIMKMEALVQLRRILFDNKKVMELGAGTGCSIISIGMVASSPIHSDDVCTSIRSQSRPRPSLLTLTDNDDNVLSLCRKNCANNLRDAQHVKKTNNKNESNGIPYKVHSLDWGVKALEGDLVPSMCTIQMQDTIIATDVIYDLSSLVPLLQTASQYLKVGGYFVLSHIPRASISIDGGRELTGDAIKVALENRILEEASKLMFVPLLESVSNSNVDACLDGSTDEDVCGLVSTLTSTSTNQFSGISDKQHVDSSSSLSLSSSAMILRPNHFMDIWENDRSIGIRKNTREKTPIMASKDCDYEELDSVGASILIFVKL